VKKCFLAFSLLFAFCAAPAAAYASEAPEGLATASEYVAHLKENYSILVKEDKTLYQEQEGASVEAWAVQLSPILAACEYLGPSFTNTLAAEDPTEYIEIKYAASQLPQPGFSTGLWIADNRENSAEGFVITGEGTLNTVIPPHIIVHEIAHCLDLSSGMAGSGAAVIDRLGYETEEGARVAGDYISERAKHSPAENYAESFAWGILNGAENPCPYGEESQVYKCCEAVFDDLVDFAGYGSRATQRMAGYLGIDISEELD
jgi:hypothetical protein